MLEDCLKSGEQSDKGICRAKNIQTKYVDFEEQENTATYFKGDQRNFRIPFIAFISFGLLMFFLYYF